MAVLFASAVGCATSPKRKAFLQEYSSRGIDPAIYAEVEARKSLGFSEIEHLLQKSVPDDLIIRHLKDTHQVYHLQSEDIDRLRAARASDNLINYLLATPSKYHVPKYYWYDYSCPPHYHYGFGHGYLHYGHHGFHHGHGYRY